MFDSLILILILSLRQYSIFKLHSDCDETWDDDLPIKYMTCDHRELMIKHCSKHADPELPNLPTSLFLDAYPSPSDDDLDDEEGENEPPKKRRKN